MKGILKEDEIFIRKTKGWYLAIIRPLNCHFDIHGSKA